MAKGEIEEKKKGRKEGRYVTGTGMRARMYVRVRGVGGACV